MIGLSRRGVFVDNYKLDEIAFEYWLKWGSLVVAAFELKKAGISKPDGTYYSYPGVKLASIRHYIRKYPETRNKVEEQFLRRGYNVPEEELDLTTINYVFMLKAVPGDIINLLRKFDLYDRYEEHILSKIKHKEELKNARELERRREKNIR